MVAASFSETLEALVSSVVDDMVEAGVCVPLVGIDSMLPVESYVVEGCRYGCPRSSGAGRTRDE